MQVASVQGKKDLGTQTRWAQKSLNPAGSRVACSPKQSKLRYAAESLQDPCGLREGLAYLQMPATLELKKQTLACQNCSGRAFEHHEPPASSRRLEEAPSTTPGAPRHHATPGPAVGLAALGALGAAGGSAEQPLAQPGGLSPAAEGASAELRPDASPAMAKLGICEAFPEAAVIQPGHPPPSSRTSSGGGRGSGDAGPVPGDVVAQGAGAAVPAGTSKAGKVPPSTAAAPGLAEGLGIPTEERTGTLPPSNSGTDLEQALEAPRAAPESMAGVLAPATAVRILEGIIVKPSAGAIGPLKGAFPKPGGGTSPPIAQTLVVDPVLGSKASSLVPGEVSDANGLVQLDDVIAMEGTLGTAQTTALSHIKSGMGFSPSAISRSAAASHTAAELLSQEITSELDKGASPPTAGAGVSLASSLYTGIAVGPTAGPPGGAANPPTPAAPVASPHAVAGGIEGVTPPFPDPVSAPSARAVFSPVSRTTKPGTTALPAANRDASQKFPTHPTQPPPAISPASLGGATVELVASASPVPSTTESSEGAPSPASNDTDPGQGTTHSYSHGTNVTAGDRPPRASTPLCATTPTLDTAATATGGHLIDPAVNFSSSNVEVTTVKHVPTGSFPAPEKAATELVSSTSKPISRAATGTASPRTANTPTGMGMAPLPSTAGSAPATGAAFPSDPSTITGPMSILSTEPHGGPSPGPFTGMASSLGDPVGDLPTTMAFTGSGATSVEAAAGESSSARLSTATSLLLSGNSAGKAQIDVSSEATAAPSSLSRYSKKTSPATDLSSFITTSPISEVGPAFGNTPAEEGLSASSEAARYSPGPDTAMPWDASPMPALHDTSPGLDSGHLEPAVGSPLPAVSITRDSAPSKVPRNGPVSESALHGPSLLLTPSSGTTALILVTSSSNPDLGSSPAKTKVSVRLSSPSRDVTFNPPTATAALGMDAVMPLVPQHFSAPNADVTSEPVPYAYMPHRNATSPPPTSSSSTVPTGGETWSRLAEEDLAGQSQGLSTDEPGAGAAAPVPSPGKQHDPTVSPPASSSVVPTTILQATATASEPTEGITAAATTIDLVGAVGMLETARPSSAAAASRAGDLPLLNDSPTTGPLLEVSPSSIALRTAAASSLPARGSPATLQPALGSDAHQALHSVSPSPSSSVTAAPHAKSPDVGLEGDLGAGMTHLPPRTALTQRAAGSLSLSSGSAVTELAMGPSAHAVTATPETGWDSTSAKRRLFLITNDYVTHPSMSQEASLQGHLGAEPTPDVPAIAHGTWPASRHALTSTEPPPEPSTEGGDAPPTRSPTSFRLLAPRGSRAALPASLDAGPASDTASLLLGTTAAQTPPLASLPVTKNAAAEGTRSRSQPAGDGSTMQTAVGSNPVENATADAWTSRTDSVNTSPGPALHASNPSRASVTPQPRAALSDQSDSTAEPTADTSSPATRDGAVGPAPGQPPSITAGAELGAHHMPPAVPSAPSSKSITAGATVGPSSPVVPSSTPEPARASSPVLGPSTAELGGGTSSPVPGSTRPVVTAFSGITSDSITGTAASSSAALAPALRLSSRASAELITAATSSHGPHGTSQPPTEPIKSTSEPSTRSSSPGTDRAQHKPLAGVSLPSVVSTRAGESTATSWAGASSTTAPMETAASSPGPSESRAAGAASPSSSKDIAVPITGTSDTERKSSTTPPSADDAAPMPATGVPLTAPERTATLPLTDTALPLRSPSPNLSTVPPEQTPSLLAPDFTAWPARGTAAPGESPSSTVPSSTGSMATGATAGAAVVATASSAAQPALDTSSPLTNRLTSATSATTWSYAPMEDAAGLSSPGTGSLPAGPLQQLTTPANSVSEADRAGGTSPTRPTTTRLPLGRVPSSHTVIPIGPPRGEMSTATAASRTAETSTARAGFAMAKAASTSNALSPASEQPVTNNQADGHALSSPGGVDIGDEGVSPTPVAVSGLTASPAARGAAEKETTMMVPDDTAVGNSTGLAPAPLTRTAIAKPTTTMLATVGEDTTTASQTAPALPVFTPSLSEATTSKSALITDSVPAQTAARAAPGRNEVAASLPSSVTSSTPVPEGPVPGQTTAEPATAALGARDVTATISRASSTAPAAETLLAALSGTAASPHLSPSTTSSGSGSSVLSPAMRTTTRPTNGSLEVPGPSHAITVPRTPFPSKRNATEEPMTGPSSILNNGATAGSAASLAVRYATSKTATGTSSPTAFSNPAAGQAPSTSPPIAQTSLGQPILEEKTAEPSRSSPTIIVHDVPGRPTSRISSPAFTTMTSPTDTQLGNVTALPSSPSVLAELALIPTSPGHGTIDSTSTSPLHVPSDDTANELTAATSPTVLDSNAVGAAKVEPQSGVLPTLARGLTTLQEGLGPFSVFGTHTAVPVLAAGGQAGLQPAFASTSIPPASATSPEPGTTDKTSPSPFLLVSAGSGNGVAKTGLAENVTPAALTTMAISPRSRLPNPLASPAQPTVTQASPAEEGGGLLGGGTATAPGNPPAATSPTATTAPTSGTQKEPATAPRASTHAISSHRNPMLTPLPEPRPTPGLSIPAVSLYPYGAEENDRGYVERKVDFNSPLFKPEIGFPFGKTLHDSLYFTDNGQIIFPPMENYVPSNPNPPPQGFSGHESLPMVAAFWDDADFSQGDGTTWYQEYLTLGSTRNALVHDVEVKIKRYMKISYTAKWTLKVTWEEAPAYPSQQDDSQTNTYQVVLTTDGNQAFALLLYQDGGMRWDYTKLAARNVLIGFSSGDGYAQNNELTEKPPAVKYRPDQYRGYDIDLRGLWIYKLDSHPRVNYRLRCLAWLVTQPDPASWNRDLPPCPCSRPQAELDPRYRRSRGLVDASVTMLRTSSPNQAGAGVRCLYRDESLLEGWQERVWSLPLHPTTDEELEAFDWCCQQVEKPSFCTRFAEKRPRASCEGYVPPTPASAFGDPHITTLDGLTYTFNGLGDFVLLLASDARTSFTLQGRTAQTGTAPATNFVAFAAQYVSTTNTTVEWTLGRQGNIQVLLNHEIIQFSYSRDMDAEVYYSPGVLVVNSSSITAIFDKAVAVSISATSGILNVVCSLPNEYLNSTKGLLGVWDHNPADDFQMPNGTSIPGNSSEEEIFSYGMTWAVGEHSLFAEPLAALVTNFTPVFLSRLRQENESQYQLAALQCRGSRECIYDTLSTGDVALGLATQSLAADFQQKKTALNAFPPIITGDASLTAYRMERVTRQYRAEGTGARFVPHVSPELNITENGTLTWEPTSTAPFTVSLEAIGANNLSAILLLSFTLCNCSRSHQCDYSDTTTVSGSSLQLAACRCDDGYSGPFCQHPPDPCAQGCFPGVSCHPRAGCGPCPAGLTGDGTHCADVDECARGTACPANATCTNTAGGYACACAPGEAGAGPGCTAACGSRACPPGYCSNGGRCRLEPGTCVPSCLCPPAFTDRRCLVAGGNFQPPASPELPRRSVQLRVRTLQNVTAGDVDGTVAAVLASLEVKAFRSNTNVTRTDDRGGFTFAVVSEFAYNSTGAVIRFLNEELRGAITAAFNGPPGRGRRAAGARVVFQRLHADNVTDLVKLTVSELRRYFPCGLSGYRGYQLDYVASVGFLCVSPCNTGYCRHGGRCQHLPDGPTCSCIPFSIFSPTGERCDQLAVSLGAFIGILLGALALLSLLIASACLVARLCRRHTGTEGAKESFWRPRPFSSLTKAEDGAETTPSEASEWYWAQQLQAIDPSLQIRIMRPHIRPLSQPAQQL
ncbi:mucin-4 [Rhea pennata]|uniref:mucin-4 n=1 Tax=Rhea pennata TaxID=8795 RepID=UPI002E255072